MSTKRKSTSEGEEAPKSPARSSSWEFLKHPLLLLVLGFGLAGVIGTWLSAQYQKREWDRQQIRLVKVNRAEAKLALIDDLIRTVSENDSTIRGFALEIALLTNIEPEKRAEIEKEIKDGFRAVRASLRKWLIESSALEHRIRLSYRDPEIARKLDELIEERHSAYLNSSFLSRSHSIDPDVFYRDDQTVTKMEKQTGEIGLKTQTLLKELTDMMYKEVDADLAL